MSLIQIGRWKQVFGYVTPGGDPVWVCAKCGGCEHLHGAEHPRIKVFCDKCGTVNLYPWQKTYEEENHAG